MTFTQPVCESCWDKEYPGREPIRLREPESERCCKCGEVTRAGVYIRIDPATVSYPREEPNG